MGVIFRNETFTLISKPKVFTSLHYIYNVLERFSIFAKCSYISMVKHCSEFKMSQWYFST